MTWNDLEQHMKSVGVSSETLAILHDMQATKLLFYGVGSRFNGYAREDSDWDFQFEPMSLDDDKTYIDFTKKTGLCLTEKCQGDPVWTIGDGGKNQIHIRRMNRRVRITESLHEG